MKFTSKIKESRLNLILLLLYPVATFYLLEWFTHNPWKTMEPTPQILNIILFELLALILYMLIGRLHIALMVETGFFLIFGLANYFVLTFRSVPIQPWDIFSIRTAASVAGGYEYTLSKQAAWTLAGFVLLLVLEFFCRKRFNKGAWKLRLPIGVLCTALLIGFVSLFRSDYIVQQKFRLYDKLFTPTTISFKNGTALAIVMELRYITVEKPSGYNAGDAKAALAAYADGTANTDGTKSEAAPNIIVIMNEAFSDPAVLGDFTSNEDYMPFVHSLMAGADDTISGYMNVSVVGGNTANTEFEFLTGSTMAFLPQGSIPYQQYIKGDSPSIASHLKTLGYRTVAMHPYGAGGWDRDQVYPWIGFDEMYFEPNYDNASRIRKYVSDESDFDKIIDIYKQKQQDQPLFLFNVTMQNHSPYTEDFDNFTPDITVDGADSKALDNYLSLMKLTDRALSELFAYFTDQEEDTMIVFFGDHQPTNSVVEPVWRLNDKSSADLTEEEQSLRYKVPYIVWANFDIEEASGRETSTNYLAAAALEAAGLPQPEYFTFLNKFSEQVPVLTAIQTTLADGTFSSAADQNELLREYRSLQYYLLFDAGK